MLASFRSRPDRWRHQVNRHRAWRLELRAAHLRSLKAIATASEPSAAAREKQIVLAPTFSRREIEACMLDNRQQTVAQSANATLRDANGQLRRFCRRRQHSTRAHAAKTNVPATSAVAERELRPLDTTSRRSS